MESFKIFEKIDALAYQVPFFPRLERTHGVFHLSTLRKCVHDPSHIVEIKPFQLVEILIYEEFLVWIIDEMGKVLRHVIVKLVKVQWGNHSKMEAKNCSNSAKKLCK